MSTFNDFHGDARNVIQARDVHVHGEGRQAVIPRMLYAAPMPFIDRLPELARLDALFNAPREPGNPGVVLVNGFGGVGKTGTGTYWAHRSDAHFPDGHLYVDLAGLSRPGVNGIGDILGRLLRALGMPNDDIPSDTDERAAQWRSISAGKRLFLLLDNAETAAQVTFLLPNSENSLVVVTSDRRLSGLVQWHGAKRVQLDPLATEHGVRLLAAIIGDERVAAEPAEANALVELCGGLPLAIRVAAGQLEARPRWRIARLVARLREDRMSGLASDGERPVEAVCEAAYAGLPDDAARMYRLIGLHPGDGAKAVTLAPEAAAMLAGVPPDEAEDLLDLLADRHLVERTEEASRRARGAGAEGSPAAGRDEGRYTIRGLIREHARRKAGEDAAAVRRLIGWYLNFAITNDNAVNPHRPVSGPSYRAIRSAATLLTGEEADRAKAEALDRLEAEQANLWASVHTAAAAGWYDLAWQLCEALWGLCFNRKPYDDWIAGHVAGMEAARRTGEPIAIFRVGIQLGRGLQETRRFEEAHRVLAEALDAARGTGDRLNEATVLEFIGRTWFEAGEYDRAEERLREALALERAGGRTRGVAIDTHHLARVLLARGDATAALSLLDEASELFENDLYNLARTLMTRGKALTVSGAPEKAREPLLRARQIMHAQKAWFQEAETLRLLSTAAERSKDPAARDYAAEAVELFESIGAFRAAAELRERL